MPEQGWILFTSCRRQATSNQPRCALSGKKDLSRQEQHNGFCHGEFTDIPTSHVGISADINLWRVGGVP